jgi:hydroxymethylpyrimidine pyrophosphatase-like HAD family hydrolase
MKKKVFLSDNDGTLTVARKPIRGEMAETLLEFSKYFKFAVVTGSPFKDMVEQMPPEILENPNIDYWCCMGNILYREGKEIQNSHNTIDFDYLNPILQEILKNCPLQYKKSFPRHHEINANCAINFTMLGRPEIGEPSLEDRCDYVDWDNINGQRRWIIDYLMDKHPEYNFTFGGQISVDIVKKGCDKAQVVNYYKDDYKISYFGDRIYKRGNDNSIAHEVVDVGGTIYSVSGPAETMRIMQTLIEQEKKLVI